jgi:hypothetical protein
MVTGADGIKPGVGSETNSRRSPVRLSTYVLNPPSLKRAFLRRHANGAERHTEKRDRANLGFFEHLTE